MSRVAWTPCGGDCSTLGAETVEANVFRTTDLKIGGSAAPVGIDCGSMVPDTEGDQMPLRKFGRQPIRMSALGFGGHCLEDRFNIGAPNVGWRSL
jgi:hypothetical protein